MAKVGTTPSTLSLLDAILTRRNASKESEILGIQSLIAVKMKNLSHE